jgi:PAS domain-containing protein
MKKVPEHGPPGAGGDDGADQARRAGRRRIQLMSDQTTYDHAQLELAEAIVAQLAAAVAMRISTRAAAARGLGRGCRGGRGRARTSRAGARGGRRRILVVSADSAVRFWNRAAESITGLTRDAVQGGTLAGLGVDWTALATRSGRPRATGVRAR